MGQVDLSVGLLAAQVAPLLQWTRPGAGTRWPALALVVSEAGLVVALEQAAGIGWDMAADHIVGAKPEAAWAAVVAAAASWAVADMGLVAAHKDTAAHMVIGLLEAFLHPSVDSTWGLSEMVRSWQPED